MELWIPITVAAAFLQNLRTALQKHLTGRLSTLGSAYARFGFGLPFAVLIVSLWASINLALNFVRSPTPQALPFCCLACVVARAVQFRRFEGAGERRVGLQLPVVLLWLSHDRLIHWRERHFPDQT